MIILPLCQIAWYRYENSRRGRLVAAEGYDDSPMAPGFTDKTDFEQEMTFRYVM